MDFFKKKKSFYVHALLFYYKFIKYYKVKALGVVQIGMVILRQGKVCTLHQRSFLLDKQNVNLCSIKSIQVESEGQQ